jgi:hypothetical protein
MDNSNEKAKRFVLIRYVKRTNTWPYIYAVDANGTDPKLKDTVHVSSGLAKGNHSYTEAVVVGFLEAGFALAQGVDYHAPYPTDDKDGKFTLLETKPYDGDTKYFGGRCYDSNGYTGDTAAVAIIRTCDEKIVGDEAVKLLDDLALLDFKRQGFVANNHILGAKYAEQQAKQDAALASIADAYGPQAAEAFKAAHPIVADATEVNNFVTGLNDLDAQIAKLKADIDKAF